MGRRVRYVLLRRLRVFFWKFGLCRMEERPTSPAPPPNCHYLSLLIPTLAGNGFPRPLSPFERAVSLFKHPFRIPECDLPHLLPLVPTVMVSSRIGEMGPELLAEYKGQIFKHDDLVDVIRGTGHGDPGIKSEPIKARFKGVVETVRGTDFFCRPLVGSARGPCPSYPRHSVFKLRAFGACVLGTRETRYFSKLKPVMQERSYVKPPPPSPGFSPPTLGHNLISNLTSSFYILQLLDTLHLREIKKDKAVARVQVCLLYFYYDWQSYYHS
jgi:hypothetical protein